MRIKLYEAREVDLKRALGELEKANRKIDDLTAEKALENEISKCEKERLALENAIVIPIENDFIEKWEKGSYEPLSLQDAVQKAYPDYLKKSNKDIIISK